MTTSNSLLFSYFSLLSIRENVLAQMFLIVLPAYRGQKWKHFYLKVGTIPSDFSLVLLNVSRPFHGGNLHSLIMPQLSQEKLASWKMKPWKFSFTLKHLTKVPWRPLPSALHSMAEWSKAFACYNIFHSEHLPNIDFFLFFFFMKSN